VRAHYEAQFAARRPEVEVSIDSREDGEWGDLLFVLAEQKKTLS